jgi:hypothetical protein
MLRWQAPSLNVTWYVTSGNHDYYGGQAGIDAEIEYSDHSNRWHFPDYYYNKELTTADGTTILIVAIDTWRINGGDTFVKFDPQVGGARAHQYADFGPPARVYGCATTLRKGSHFVPIPVC